MTSSFHRVLSETTAYVQLLNLNILWYLKIFSAEFKCRFKSQSCLFAIWEPFESPRWHCCCTIVVPLTGICYRRESPRWHCCCTIVIPLTGICYRRESPRWHCCCTIVVPLTGICYRRENTTIKKSRWKVRGKTVKELNVSVNICFNVAHHQEYCNVIHMHTQFLFNETFPAGMPWNVIMCKECFNEYVSLNDSVSNYNRTLWCTAL